MKQASTYFPDTSRQRSLGEERLPLALFLIFLLGLLLRVYGLSHQSLWIDEIITLRQGLVPGHGLWEQFLDDYHNPLPMVVITTLARMSHAEQLLRFPGALLGSLSVLLIFFLGRRLSSARVGLLAALLLAVNPFHIFHSQELRGYAWMIFFGLATALVAVNTRDRLSWPRAILLAVLGIATALCNLEGLFWMGSLALACTAAGKVHRHDLRAWGVAFGLMVLVTSPWWTGISRTHHEERLLPGQETGIPMRGQTTLGKWAIPYAGFVLAMGNTMGPTPLEIHAESEETIEAKPRLERRHWPAVAGVAGIVLVLGVSGIVALRSRTWLLLLWVALPVLVAVWLAARNVKPLNPRYCIAALPALMLLLAAGIDALPRKTAFMVLIAWLAFSAVADYRYHFVPQYQREDVRGAVRLVEEREGPKDFILAPTVYRVFQWYYRGSNPVEPYWWSKVDHSLADVTRRLDQLDPARKYAWYVRCRPWHDDPNGWLLASFEENWRSRALFRLPGVEVYLFERKETP